MTIDAMLSGTEVTRDALRLLRYLLAFDSRFHIKYIRFLKPPGMSEDDLERAAEIMWLAFPIHRGHVWGQIDERLFPVLSASDEIRHAVFDIYFQRFCQTPYPLYELYEDFQEDIKSHFRRLRSLLTWGLAHRPLETLMIIGRLYRPLPEFFDFYVSRYCQTSWNLDVLYDDVKRHSAVLRDVLDWGFIHRPLEALAMFWNIYRPLQIDARQWMVFLKQAYVLAIETGDRLLQARFKRIEADRAQMESWELAQRLYEQAWALYQPEDDPRERIPVLEGLRTTAHVLNDNPAVLRYDIEISELKALARLRAPGDVIP